MAAMIKVAIETIAAIEIIAAIATTATIEIIGD